MSRAEPRTLFLVACLFIAVPPVALTVFGPPGAGLVALGAAGFVWAGAALSVNRQGDRPLMTVGRERALKGTAIGGFAVIMVVGAVTAAAGKSSAAFGLTSVAVSAVLITIAAPRSSPIQAVGEIDRAVSAPVSSPATRDASLSGYLLVVAVWSLIVATIGWAVSHSVWIVIVSGVAGLLALMTFAETRRQR